MNSFFRKLLAFVFIIGALAVIAGGFLIDYQLAVKGIAKSGESSGYAIGGGLLGVLLAGAAIGVIYIDSQTE
jgi:hypothetical protein